MYIFAHGSYNTTQETDISLRWYYVTLDKFM